MSGERMSAERRRQIIAGLKMLEAAGEFSTWALGNELLLELDAVTRERDEEKARLDWLEKHGDGLTTHYETCEGETRISFSTRDMEQWPPEYYGDSGFDLRAVIDAAMEAPNNVT
jgi:hypothetical protein